MSFGDIEGQDSALEILKEGIQKARIFSSYLFVGPDGVGKSEAAKEFAKALNCRARKGPEPCGTCVSCTKIDSRTHPDVFFTEPKGASSSIGIDEIRTVITRANLKPYEGRKKVFVIDGAHSLGAEASNAFLKTLEEPPGNTVFILISRSKELLLSTIVSRCHVIKFFALPRRTVERLLAERFGAKKDEARILSNFSSGCVGRAVRMKSENLIEKKNRVIDSLSDPNGALAEEIGIYSGREELKEKLEFIIAYLRDVFAYNAAGDEKTIFHIDRIDRIKKESRRFAAEDLDYLIKKIITLRSYIDYNVNPKIIVDVAANEIGRVIKRSQPCTR